MTSREPRVAFCTTCKGRKQHLAETLRRNLADNLDYPNAVFVVLDYNDSGELAEYMRSDWSAEIASGRVVYYRMSADIPFAMAHAKNMAHRCGLREGAEILCNVDADNYTGPGFARWLADTLGSRDAAFCWANMVKDGTMARGISGRIALTRRAFLCAGGYDEKYATWSPDDKDLNLRLQRLGYVGVEIPRQHLEAIRHNDRMRFKEYRHAACADEGEWDIHIHDSTDTIANYGHVGCGVVYRNFDSTPILLHPIPTRIFGVGMHKTATTSLHHALRQLGYDSAHWRSAHWAKAIWDEMQSEGRSLTLEQHYALSDLPITLLYEKLDAAYPGSKFILTLRDEDTWLRSVERHWSHEHNPFRAAWSTDPFTHRVHRELYGQKGFDAALFLSRYRRHNAEVQEYFRERPHDLLVMQMDRGAGWRELCTFLSCPEPSGPYPKEFQTSPARPVEEPNI